MALDLTGIANQNEFYSDHYLRTILEKDLEDWVKTTDKSDEDVPRWKKLQGLERRFLELLDRFRRIGSANDRLSLQREFVKDVLWALGYQTQPREVTLASGVLSVFATVEHLNRPYIWVVEALDGSNCGDDVLQLPVDPSQVEHPPSAATLDRLLGEAFFTDEPARWVIVVSLRAFVLLDRTKWSGHRAISFDWEELYNRRTRIRTYQLIAMLLSKDCLVPAGGQASMLDTIDQKSKSHAQSVSGSLKYALREAVELLGNEYLHYRRSVQRKAIYDGAVNPDKLSVECLRYMYRLLFLFTVEARPELGYLPMKAGLYRKGYSLERLRDLEMVSLAENGSSEGSFLDEAVQTLFRLVFDGHSEGDRQQELGGGKNTFDIAPLQSSLFDPEGTPLLNSIRIRNSVWQRIIRMMSLGHEDYQDSKRTGKGSKAQGRGRISYSHLGINHLGEVYEALLSYRGFIASEDLYEVKQKGVTSDVLEPAYFVNEEALKIHHDDESERVFDKEGRLVRHPKGTFIYRLTGRAREESASYYTPESLTRCVVRYALKEVLEGKSADDILNITVCEPAMGSAAFLNEAISQLAEVYLNRKSRELNDTLPADEYAKQLQRVKMYLADNNVYGVDLNPIAVELGGVSLWLNTLVPGGFVPWFGNQIKCGNSLVGAWSRVYTGAELTAGKWWEQVPDPVSLTDGREAGAVYHFLVGDTGMANYKSSIIKNVAEQEIQHIRTWRKGFTAKCTHDEIARMRHLSRLVDALWKRHIADLRLLERQTTDDFAIYGRQSNVQHKRTTTRTKDERLRDILNPIHGINASAYQRLKLVMDYWCALWYWPIKKARLLPTRSEYLGDIALLLAGREPAMATSLLESGKAVRDLLGYVDLDALIVERPRLQEVRHLSTQYRFHHWQLEFADQFCNHGGFDLVLGNPPWRKVSWVEKNIIADSEPRFATKKYSASRTADLRPSWLCQGDNTLLYISEYEDPTALNNFLNATQNFPLLKGVSSNLYKSFLHLAWGLQAGAVGLLHPDSVFDDAKASALRTELYSRLRYHFQFANGLMLFPEIHDQVRFSVNVYGRRKSAPKFVSIFNLFDAKTVQQSFEHDSSGQTPGIKDTNNNWALAGHKRRIIWTTQSDLDIYSALFDPVGTQATGARLPMIHSVEIATVLHKLAKWPHRLRDFGNSCYYTGMWHESGAQKAGTIRRNTQFPNSPQDWVLSGPHFFVATLLFKTPNRTCEKNSDYTRLDLTVLPDTYLPRTNYEPPRKQADFEEFIPTTHWGVPVTDLYRIGFRGMLSRAGERTLIPTVVPPGMGHIHAVFSIAIREAGQTLLRILHGVVTIVLDFLVKVAGKGFLGNDLIAPFPVLDYDERAGARLRGLTCPTRDFEKLWNDTRINNPDPGWAKQDKRLARKWFDLQSLPWSRQSALRTDFERRQALIELDVLFAQAIGLSLDELCAIYRIQFPVLQSYENDTWYDQQGRIIFSAKKGEGGLPRKKRGKDRCYGIRSPNSTKSNIALGWEDVRRMQEGVVTYTFLDDTLPGEPFERTIEYHAPFDRCNREEDYAEAWEFFARNSPRGSS